MEETEPCGITMNSAGVTGAGEIITVKLAAENLESWDDEDEVRADLARLDACVKELRAKYGDRLHLYASDPFDQWGSASIALERERKVNRYGVRTVRRDAAIDID